MKKSLLSIILITIVVSFGFTATSENRAINVYGQIGVGGITFGVTENTTVSTPANLLADTMNPDANGTYAAGEAPGIKIGSWSFSGTNQLAKTYTLTYTFSSLAYSGVNIPFQINEDGGTWLDTTDTTTYSAIAGTPAESRDIFARLTSVGRGVAESATAGTYTSTISVNLAAD